MIGAFDDASRVVTLDEDDQSRYTGWEVTNKQSFQQEMVEFLTWHVSSLAMVVQCCRHRASDPLYSPLSLCFQGRNEARGQFT